MMLKNGALNLHLVLERELSLMQLEVHFMRPHKLARQPRLQFTFLSVTVPSCVIPQVMFSNLYTDSRPQTQQAGNRRT